MQRVVVRCVFEYFPGAPFVHKMMQWVNRFGLGVGESVADGGQRVPEGAGGVPRGKNATSFTYLPNH